MGKGQELYKKAKKIIPGGTQLLSKRPEMFLPDFWPSYYSKAKGCEVWDLDGNHYYDGSLMGVGANVLGYAFDPVDFAAKQAIENGGMCTLNAPEEVELAELLIETHPWASMVRYAKTGGEAMAMAVRIARAKTKKDIVLVCGYHGWHDWYLSANLVIGDPLADVHLKGLEPTGVPIGLAGSNFIFHYNDLQTFNQLVEQYKGEIAAVVMEPIRNDYPTNNFLQEIRKATVENNILLVFDEVSAGFRLCCGGSHLVLGVEPDMAVFAKGMTNGYPLAAIIGRANAMNAAQETFISSTFWTERVALAATIAAIRYYKENDVHLHQIEMGEQVQKTWSLLAEKHSLHLDTGGIPPLSHFAFKYNNSMVYKTLFTQEMLKKGWLASTAFYTSWAHTNEIMQKYSAACDEVFSKIAQFQRDGVDIADKLEGPVCHTGFERLN